jgi:hypothetical protein
VIINFEKAIPKHIQARKAKLIMFLMTGNENTTQFSTKIRVIDQDD